MAATMDQIRAGLIGTLTTALGATWTLNEYATSMSIAPFIAPLGADIEYDEAMNAGSDKMEWTILACVPAPSDQGSQINLEKLVGPRSATSLKTLVEADRTLGGTVSWARVVSVTKPRLYSSPGNPEALGVEFTLEVMT